jgi:hypothetical protein
VASITWDGLDGLLEDLEALPENLIKASNVLAEEAANQAAAAIRQAYPYGKGHPENVARGWPGHLRDGVIVRTKYLEYGIRARVLNTAPYAYAFESGRRKGKHGTTPARPTFIPIREEYQRGFIDALEGLMIREGLKVYGSADGRE